MPSQHRLPGECLSDAQGMPDKSGKLPKKRGNDYCRICTLITEALGKPRLVEDLDSRVFGLLKAQLVEDIGVQVAANLIRQLRTHCVPIR